MEIFILGTAFGALTTYVIQQVMMYYAMRNLQELLGKELLDKLSEIDHAPGLQNQTDNSQIKTRIEEIDGVFYIFNADNNEFVAQGATMTEIQEHMNARMIKSDVVVTAGDTGTVEKFRKLVNISNN